MQVTTTSSTAPNNLIDADKQGFAGLTAEDFLKMLVVELQNQDPSEPMKNEDLLNQLTAMQSLQSNSELSDSLSQVTANLQLSTGSSFIGKQITGKTAAGNDVTGIVDRAFLVEGKTSVGIGAHEIPLKNIASVNQTEA